MSFTPFFDDLIETSVQKDNISVIFYERVVFIMNDEVQ